MHYDSNEERYFGMWLEELRIEGWIAEYKRAETIVLSPKVQTEYVVPMKRVADKIKHHTVLNGHVFTPDFEVRWQPKALGVFITELNENAGKITTPLKSQNLTTIIETKADYDMNNMNRLASINIKMAYHIDGTFVNMVKMPSWFKKTFCPMAWLFTKTNKPRKVKFTKRTLEEYLSSVTPQQNLFT